MGDDKKSVVGRRLKHKIVLMALIGLSILKYANVISKIRVITVAL